MEGMDITQELKILIEITSGRSLLIGDISSSDPYVVVSMGNEQVHKTKYISKTLDPDWGPEHNSTFLLQCPGYKLVDADGLVFTVRDYDAFSSDEDLGTVRVCPGDLVTEGSRSQVYTRKITPPKSRREKEAGYLTIHVRHATAEDEASMNDGENKRLFAAESVRGSMTSLPFAAESVRGSMTSLAEEDQAAVNLM